MEFHIRKNWWHTHTHERTHTIVSDFTVHRMECSFFSLHVMFLLCNVSAFDSFVCYDTKMIISFRQINGVHKHPNGISYQQRYQKIDKEILHSHHMALQNSGHTFTIEMNRNLRFVRLLRLTENILYTAVYILAYLCVNVFFSLFLFPNSTYRLL